MTDKPKVEGIRDIDGEEVNELVRNAQSFLGAVRGIVDMILRCGLVVTLPWWLGKVTIELGPERKDGAE